MNEGFADDLVGLDAATGRLVATVSALGERDVRAPSLLPGWTVGHVLTHIARNADGMVNLTTWALTGVPTPMYPSVEARGADIEAGSARPAGEIVDDVAASAERLASRLTEVGSAPVEVLDRLLVFGPMREGQEPDTPAHALPYHRTREVEIHHVDLGLAAYSPGDWPPDFVERTLLWIHARTGAVDVVGEPAEVLAWRIGRGTGPSVRRLDGSLPGDPPSRW